MFMKKILLLVSLTIIIPGLLLAQKEGKETTDSTKTEAPKFKSIEDFFKDEVEHQPGLFGLYKNDGKLFFEIHDDLLEDEILVVSRIKGHVKGLNFGGAGMRSRPQQVIRWQKHGDKLLLRSVSYNAVADEEDPIYQSVIQNNFEPIIMTFPIKAVGKDSTSYLVNVSSLFTKDIDMVGALSANDKKRFGIKRLDSDRSMVTTTKSFPTNTEVSHILTYTGSKLPDNQITGTLSVEMNQSFIQLPEEPMMPRLYDERVSYFSLRQTDYSMDVHTAGQKRFITKWRLEPKDWDAYNRGELVEPVKPIVYYIDPATPTQWVKYIKEGVDVWQDAFEYAGFKNAIYAKEAPSKEEDPDWSPEDVRYSVIRYVATDIQNAMGPHVHDPRTGEILESDIIWYHNVMKLLRNWYLIQTAAVNPDAQKAKFTDEVMGELIKFVAAHEVGHTLGLPHNMGSSSAYPVDSLRSPTFTATHGTAPSIMDYARFNYVAQPEDNVTNFYPSIGEYDNWSIEFGYRLIPGADSPEAERATINEWIKAKADDPAYRFGFQNRVDPSAQTEDLGDDAVYASQLGIKNLQRIVPKITTFAYKEAENNAEVQELYTQVVNQLNRYCGHVATNVGGVYQYNKTMDQDGAIFVAVPKARQQKAVQFFIDEIFNTPSWLLNQEMMDLLGTDQVYSRVQSMQGRTLGRLLSYRTLNRMVDYQAASGYSVDQLFDELTAGLFANTSLDQFKRKLQVDYAKGLMAMLEADSKANADVQAVAANQLNDLEELVKKQKKKASSAVDKAHFERLEKMLSEN